MTRGIVLLPLAVASILAAQWAASRVSALSALPAPSSGADTIWVARFSLPEGPEASPPASPPGWRPIDFGGGRGNTSYRVSERDGRRCLQAATQGGGSGLLRPLEANPLAFPRLRWSWWVEGPVPGGDLRRKEGDDFAARLYVNFRFDASRSGFLERLGHRLASRRFGADAPGRSLVYIWGNLEAAGTVAPNPYTEQAMMVVVRSGELEAGRWWEEERNILDDFRRAFGEAPPGITSLAIMSDGDDTGGSASACYGDVLLLGGAA